MSTTRKIFVSQLQVGCYVQLPLAWKDHPFLFSNFKIKQQAQIELIKKLGIKQVFIDIEKSDAEPLQAHEIKETVVTEDLSKLEEEMDSKKNKKIEVLKKMRRDIKKTEQNFNRSVAQMRSMISKLRSRPLNAVNEAKDLVHDIATQLLDSDNLVLHLMGDAKNDEGIYYHSLNVAVLSMLIAKELGWEKAAIEEVGLGALFHDIGKLKVPAQLLKKATLTKPEINYLKQHPTLGVELAKLAETFPSTALPIIQNHHEYLDGSGYPKGLTSDSLSAADQLVAVVNQYDEFCHPAPQTKARTPYAALGTLYKHYKSKLNQEYVGKMIKMLGVYPPGSVVELSSGQFGLVMGVNLNQLLLPRIMVYDALVPQDQAPIIDLEDEGLTITRCLPPAALPEKVFKYLNPRERVSYYFGGDKK